MAFSLNLAFISDRISMSSILPDTDFGFALAEVCAVPVIMLLSCCSNRVVDAWNHLPDHVVNVTSLSSLTDYSILADIVICCFVSLYCCFYKYSLLLL